MQPVIVRNELHFLCWKESQPTLSSYSCITGEWTQHPPLPINEEHYAVTAVNEHEFAVVGGRETADDIPPNRVYNVNTKSWYPLPELKRRRDMHACPGGVEDQQSILENLAAQNVKHGGVEELNVANLERTVSEHHVEVSTKKIRVEGVAVVVVLDYQVLDLRGTSPVLIVASKDNLLIDGVVAAWKVGAVDQLEGSGADGV